MEPESERRPGNSRLVYDKMARTIRPERKSPGEVAVEMLMAKDGEIEQAWAALASKNIELAQLRREVERLREVKAIRDEITDALEAAGYFHMSNGEGVASILRELAELRAAQPSI